MVLVEGCDCGGFWVNRFFSDNQDCPEVYVQSFKVLLMLSLSLYVSTVFLQMTFLWNIRPSGRFSLIVIDSNSPSTAGVS